MTFTPGHRVEVLLPSGVWAPGVVLFSPAPPLVTVLVDGSPFPLAFLAARVRPAREEADTPHFVVSPPG